MEYKDAARIIIVYCNPFFHAPHLTPFVSEKTPPPYLRLSYPVNAYFLQHNY
jgi:hypothetical protein